MCRLKMNYWAYVPTILFGKHCDTTSILRLEHHHVYRATLISNTYCLNWKSVPPQLSASPCLDAVATLAHYSSILHHTTFLGLFRMRGLLSQMPEGEPCDTPPKWQKRSCVTEWRLFKIPSVLQDKTSKSSLLAWECVKRVGYSECVILWCEIGMRKNNELCRVISIHPPCLVHR